MQQTSIVKSGRWTNCYNTACAISIFWFLLCFFKQNIRPKYALPTSQDNINLTETCDWTSYIFFYILAPLLGEKYFLHVAPPHSPVLFLTRREFGATATSLRLRLLASEIGDWGRELHGEWERLLGSIPPIHHRPSHMHRNSHPNIYRYFCCFRALPWQSGHWHCEVSVRLILSWVVRSNNDMKAKA